MGWAQGVAIAGIWIGIGVMSFSPYIGNNITAVAAAGMFATVIVGFFVE